MIDNFGPHNAGLEGPFISLNILLMFVSNDFQSTCKQTATTKISALGFSPVFYLVCMRYNQTKAFIKQSIADIVHQMDLARARNSIYCESNFVSLLAHLIKLKMPKH